MPLINIDNLIGRRNGIIKEVYTVNVDSTEPNIFSFVAERAMLEWENSGQDAISYGSGGGFTKMQALLSACGEVIERYCSSFLPQDGLEGSYRELQKDYKLLDPEKVQLFSEIQYATTGFPFKKFTRETNVEWVKAYSFKDQLDIYVPAFLVYLPYNKKELGGSIAPSSSAGLACAPTFEEAAERAALELIERDAFAVFWLNQLSPPKIKIDGLDGGGQLMERFKFSDIEYTLLDLTSDFEIPIAAAFCFGNSSFGYLAAMGLGTSGDLASALKKALVENASGRKAVYFYRKKDSNKQYRSDFKDVLSFHDHGYVYSTDKMLKNKLNFVFKSSMANQSSTNKKPGQIGAIECLLNSGFDVIAKDLTTPDIAQNGLAVARVIVPGLAQLHGMHPFPFLGCQRLYQPRKVFSWSNKNITTEEKIINFPPHMLP